VAQRACDKFGGDLLSAFHRQHGDAFFACIADYREVFPWPRVAAYPTMSRIHEGLREGFIRRSVYDAEGQLLESMSAVDQPRPPDEVGGYVDDMSMVVSLNAAADAAALLGRLTDPAQLGRLTGKLVQSFSGPQIFSRLQRLVDAGPEGLTAGDKSKVWELIANGGRRRTQRHTSDCDVSCLT
jgi:hypothetical protein